MDQPDEKTVLGWGEQKGEGAEDTSKLKKDERIHNALIES